MKILNWELISNPLNWAIVFLMVLIAGIGLHFITNHVQLATSGDH